MHKTSDKTEGNRAQTGKQEITAAVGGFPGSQALMTKIIPDRLY